MTGRHRDIGKAVGHYSESTAFFGAIMAGLLLGFLFDKLFGTDPALIVVGIVSGSVVGFWRMWQLATKDDNGH